MLDDVGLVYFGALLLLPSSRCGVQTGPSCFTSWKYHRTFDFWWLGVGEGCSFY